MKKLSLVLCAGLLLACSKETDLIYQETTENTRQLSAIDAFKVGEVDGSGNAGITYDMAELKDICACAVGEEIAAELDIDQVGGGTYYLTGEGSSTGSITTFAVTLTVDGSDLMWEDEAFIGMCQTESATPCTLTITGSETFTCDNGTPASCSENEAGGTSGQSYSDCNWPWAGKAKDKN